MRQAALLALASAVFGLLAGCGGSPPSGQVQTEIRKAMADGREGVEARSVRLGSWTNKDMPGMFSATWAGKLRLKEDHAYIVARVDGKNIVRVVAKAGDELESCGRVVASKPEKVRDWSISAFADSEKGKGWDRVAEQAGPIQMGYPVVNSDGSRSTAFRSGFAASDFFQPLSQLKPCIVEGSDEYKKLEAELAERQRKEAEAYAARVKAQQDAAAAQQARLKAEAEERQRLAAEKAAADQRAREERAREQAEAARVQRLSPVLAPFKPGAGAVVATDAGPELGCLLYDAQLDESAFKVAGKGLDLREMPFKEFTFECSAADNNGRASFTYSRSDADPLALSPIAGGLGARGVTLAALSQADRASLDALASLGRQLGSAPPIDLAVEILDAAAAKARQMDIQTEALAGTIIHKGKNAPQLAPLFTPAGTRGNAWTAEPLSIRLKQPARGSGLLFKGVNATDNVLVVINGIHKARISAIEKGGAAIVLLPPGLDVLEVKLQAVGTASSRGIVLVK
jgi:hypothetical protein